MTALATATDSFTGFLDIARDRVRWRSHAWMIALLVIVVASIGSSLSYTAKADRDINQQFEAKQALYREQAERITQLDQLKNQEIEFATQAAIDVSLIDAVPRSRVLAEVSNALSPGIRLLAISLNAQTDAPTDHVANLLHIKGIAASDAQLPQFVARLAKSPWLQTVKLLRATANVVGEKSSRNFEVEAVFGPNAAGDGLENTHSN